MNPFVSRSNYEIKEAIRKILEDAKREIEEYPERSGQIKAFCEEIIETNNNFFEKYRNESEKVDSKNESKNIER